MKKNPNQHNRSYEGEQNIWRSCVPGILAVLLLILALAIWKRPGNPPHRSDEISATLAQDDLRRDFAQHSGSWARGAELEYGADAEEQYWDGLWAAFVAAQSLEDPIEQEAALNRCMEGLTPAMAANLLAKLRPEELKSVSAQRLFDHWASAKPSEAAGWAQTQEDAQTRQSFLYVAALRWAVSDLSEAAAWARGLPEVDSRKEIIMGGVGSIAVRSDPLEALRLAVELPVGAAQSDLICRAAAEWAATDRDSALKWVEQIADTDLRQRVTAQVLVASAEQDPVRAATIALQQMSPGEELDRAVVSIVQRWVQTDPAGASSWVSEFPENRLGREAIDNLVNLWAGRDLVASGNWLLTLRAGELRNAGILAYSRVLRRTDAALAERWTLSVTGDY